MNWYTVKETALKLKVGEDTITKWLRDGRFPHAKKVGRKWLIPECCLDGHEGSEKEATKQELPESQVALIKEREDLKLEIEVKELKVKDKKLKAELAGISSEEDQDKIATDRVAVDRDIEKVSERESAVEEGETQLDIDKRAFKKVQGDWPKLFANGQADLRTISKYYKEVCDANYRAKEILEPLMLINPEWYEEIAGQIID